MLEENAIDLDGNSEEFRANNTSNTVLRDFLDRNCSQRINSQVLYQRLKLFYANHEEKMPLTYNSSSDKILQYLKAIVLSLLYSINEQQTETKIQKIKREFDEQGLNPAEVDKLKIKINNQELKAHVASHFLKYFVNKPFGPIKDIIRQVRRKIHYEKQTQQTIFEPWFDLPQIDFPFDIKAKFSCNCQMTSSQRQVFKPKVVSCCKCLSIYHPECQSNVLLCCKCILLQNSLRTKVIKTVCLFYVFPRKFINAIQFQVPEYEAENLKSNDKGAFQLRVLKISAPPSKNTSNALLLGNYGIYLNDESVKVPPGALISGEPIKLPSKSLERINVLVVKWNDPKKMMLKAPITPDKVPIFIIGILKVKSTKMSAKVPQQITIEQSKLLLSQCLSKQKISALKLQLKDPTSGKRVQTPVRGVNCKHFRCFDWQTYYKSSTNDPTRLFKRKIAIAKSKQNCKVESGRNASQLEEQRKKLSREYRDAQQNKKVLDNFRKTQKKQIKCPVCLISIQKVYTDPLVRRVLKDSSPQTTEIRIDKNGNFEEYPSHEDQKFINIVDVDDCS